VGERDQPFAETFLIKGGRLQADGDVVVDMGDGIGNVRGGEGLLRSLAEDEIRKGVGVDAGGAGIDFEKVVGEAFLLSFGGGLPAVGEYRAGGGGLCAFRAPVAREPAFPPAFLVDDGDLENGTKPIPEP